MAIIRKYTRLPQQCLVFEGDEGRGFSFDCDPAGIVDLNKLTETGRESYARCLDRRFAWHRRFIQRWETGVPALFQCPGCDHQFELLAFTNTCDGCGRDYNQGGQGLAPRSQWGEDTGESLGDILSIGHHHG